MILGLLGRAAAGKTTVANYLRDRYGARLFSIADPLKRLVKASFDFTEEQVNGTQEQKEAIDPRYGISPRQILIRIGHHGREVLGQNVWINACFNDMYALYPGEDHALTVITDVRYTNEAAALKFKMQGQGFVLKLVCPDARTNVDPNAASEQSVDDVPENLITETIIEPYGSLNLLNRVDDFLTRFRLLDPV